MKSYLVMRPVTRFEIENGLQPEGKQYEKVVSCPTMKDAEIVVKCLEAHTFWAHLTIIHSS